MNETVDEYARSSARGAYAHLSRGRQVPVRELYQLIDEAFKDGFHSELEHWACFTGSLPQEREDEKRRQRNRAKRARRKK